MATIFHDNDKSIAFDIWPIHDKNRLKTSGSNSYESKENASPHFIKRHKIEHDSLVFKTRTPIKSEANDKILKLFESKLITFFC